MSTPIAIPIPSTGAPCDMCGLKIFAITTCDDYIYCCICRAMVEDNCYHKLPNIESLDKYYPYCKECNTLFRYGCIHGVNGCMDDIDHGMLVNEYTFDSIKYVGMPRFESLEHANAVLHRMELKWKCTCTAQYDCKKAAYPEPATHNCKYA